MKPNPGRGADRSRDGGARTKGFWLFGGGGGGAVNGKPAGGARNDDLGGPGRGAGVTIGCGSSASGSSTSIASDSLASLVRMALRIPFPSTPPRALFLHRDFVGSFPSSDFVGSSTCTEGTSVPSAGFGTSSGFPSFAAPSFLSSASFPSASCPSASFPSAFFPSASISAPFFFLPGFSLSSNVKFFPTFLNFPPIFSAIPLQYVTTGPSKCLFCNAANLSSSCLLSLLLRLLPSTDRPDITFSNPPPPQVYPLVSSPAASQLLSSQQPSPYSPTASVS